MPVEISVQELKLGLKKKKASPRKILCMQKWEKKLYKKKHSVKAVPCIFYFKAFKVKESDVV